jgi:hypothetical protein
MKIEEPEEKADMESGEENGEHLDWMGRPEVRPEYDIRPESINGGLLLAKVLIQALFGVSFVVGGIGSLFSWEDGWTAVWVGVALLVGFLFIRSCSRNLTLWLAWRRIR